MSEAREQTPTPRRTRVVVGGFLCAIGLAVLVLVVAMFNASPRAPANHGALALTTLATFALGTIAIFAAVNARRLAGPRRRAARRGVMAAGGALIAWSALAFAPLATPASVKPVYDQFAIALPYDEAAPEAATAPAPAEAARPGRTTQIVWWVARDQPKVPAGALPMLLGGLLIVAFGVTYSGIAQPEAKMALGNAEKLIGSLASIALVALGLGQSADAAKTDTNARMARQGLPPVNLTRTERESRQYLIAKDLLNPESRSLINASLTELYRQAANQQASQTALQGSLAQLSSDLTRVATALNNPDPPQPVVLKDDRVAVAALSGKVDALVGAVAANNPAQGFTALSAAMTADQCRVANENLKLALENRARFREAAAQGAGWWTRAQARWRSEKAVAKVAVADDQLSKAAEIDAKEAGLFAEWRRNCAGASAAAPTAAGATRVEGS